MRRSWLLVGLMVSLAAAGCGTDESSGVTEAQGALTGGWTTLTLENGWRTVTGTTAPAVGLYNGTTVFRGVLDGHLSSSSTAFHLPSTFRPTTGTGNDYVDVRVAFAGSGGGTLTYNPKLIPGGEGDNVTIVADPGLSLSYVSLDGAAFDLTGDSSTAIPYDTTEWQGVYAHRVQGPHGLDQAALAKSVDGFVHFQGYLTSADPTFPNYLFTLPAAFRTNQQVTVPVALGAVPSQTLNGWGQITIYPSGDVYVNGNPYSYAAGTSLEGAFYSRTVTGNSALTLVNGWTSGARQARVGNYGGVIRFQGSISGGTNVSFGTLPLAMRPPRDVTIVAAAYGGVPVAITVQSTGNLKVSTAYVPLSVTAMFLSLDGLSFGI